MKILNPFQMNDWPIKHFLITIFSIQITVCGLIGLDSLNVHIPLLRQLLCFFYLSFIPGFIIMRVLKIHQLNIGENLLYSLALSLSSLMFLGFFINFFYPLVGIKYPFQMGFIVLTSSVFVILMCTLSFFRDKDFNNPVFIDLNLLKTPWILFLSLIPFISIFGAYLMNSGTNIVQMALLLFIAVSPLVVLKWIPKKFYPLVIFVVSLALLFHTSLISDYLWGSDVNVEKYFSSLVINNGYWNFNIKDNVNAMLSIVVLAPLYSIFLQVKLVWVFKILYPFFFSFLPLSLFYVYQKISNSKIAFMATFFFISTNAFFTTLVAASRQEIAELFFGVLILLTLNKRMKSTSKTILLIICGLSIAVSHYGLSYLMILIILIATLITWVPVHRVFEAFKHKKDYNLLNRTITLLFGVFAIAWFMYISNSSVLNIGVNLVNNAYSAMLDILGTAPTQSSAIITSSMPLFQSLEKYLYLLSQFLIGIGIISIFTRYNPIKNNQEYKIFSIAAFTILLFAVFIPFFASSMNTDRIFHISLILLSPFFVFGTLTLFSALNKLSIGKIQFKNGLYYVAVFLMIFSLFNSAFIYQIFDQPKQGRFALDENYDFAILSEKELVSAQWLADNYNNKTRIYADVNKAVLINFIAYKPLNARSITMWDINGTNLNNSYLFFGRYNIESNMLYVWGQKSKLLYYNSSDLDLRKSRIYDNGGSFISF